jgi:hypothetical protein
MTESKKSKIYVYGDFRTLPRINKYWEIQIIEFFLNSKLPNCNTEFKLNYFLRIRFSKLFCFISPFHKFEGFLILQAEDYQISS